MIPKLPTNLAAGLAAGLAAQPKPAPPSEFVVQGASLLHSGDFLGVMQHLEDMILRAGETAAEGTMPAALAAPAAPVLDTVRETIEDVTKAAVTQQPIAPVLKADVASAEDKIVAALNGFVGQLPGLMANAVTAALKPLERKLELATIGTTTPAAQ